MSGINWNYRKFILAQTGLGQKFKVSETESVKKIKMQIMLVSLLSGEIYPSQIFDFLYHNCNNVSQRTLMSSSEVSDTFSFWHFPLWTLFPKIEFRTRSVSDTCRYWRFSKNESLTLSVSDTSRYWHLQFSCIAHAGAIFLQILLLPPDRSTPIFPNLGFQLFRIFFKWQSFKNSEFIFLLWFQLFRHRFFSVFGIVFPSFA